MSSSEPWKPATDLARLLASESVDLRTARTDSSSAPPSPEPGEPKDPLAEFDRRVTDQDLRVATRSRFVSEHYADAVEAGVKALCECIRNRSGRTDDGDSLVTFAFSPKAPLLRINKGRSRNDESEQRGHMFLCQGVIGAWRNPRAHALIDDSPERALMMLETIGDLIATTKSATRTRQRRTT